MQNIFIALDFIKKLYRSRYMLKMLAFRELKATYVGSIFGILWAVMSPLFQVALYGVVFGVFFKSTPDPVYRTDSYLLFLLTGLVPWQFFSQTITTSSTTLISNTNLIKKAVGFPSELLPIVTVISNIISHLISLALLFLAIFIFNAKVFPSMLLIPVYIFLTAVFSVGLGWILSSVNVFIKDIQQILGLILMALFFLTPIFYNPSIVPPKFLLILKLNPAYQLVEGYRLALLTGRALPTIDFIYFAGASFFTLAVGGVFFRKLKPWFAEVL
ncbi:ABC transporter permease [bacterium]|nr:MAG: ABC transporter permease [bacterium]